MEMLEKMEEKIERTFSRRQLDVIVRFVNALEGVRDDNATIMVAGLRDGPIEMKMLDVSHVSGLVITILRSDKDNQEFCTEFNLVKLERFLKAVPQADVIEVSMTNPTSTNRGPYYRDLELAAGHVWMKQRAPGPIGQTELVDLPVEFGSKEIVVMNADFKAAMALFGKDGLIEISVDKGRLHRISKVYPDNDFGELCGIFIPDTVSRTKKKYAMFDWGMLKRLMKTFIQVGGKDGKTTWKIGVDEPAGITMKLDEITVWSALAPRIEGD